jgi:hypothetical protein
LSGRLGPAASRRNEGRRSSGFRPVMSLPAFPTFDLAELSARWARMNKAVRQVLVLVAALFGGCFVWFLFIVTAPPPPSGLVWVVVPIPNTCLGLVVGLALLVTWKLRGGATRLVVRNDGLESTWPSGKVDLLPWEGLRKGFRMEDYSGSELLARYAPDGRWELRRWNRPVTMLSREAFEAILRGAAAHGLKATIRPSGTGPIRWIGCQLVRFS